MRRKTSVGVVLLLMVLSSVACSVSGISAFLEGPLVSEPTSPPPDPVIVEVTPTPLSPEQSLSAVSPVIDIEEQLVIDVYARVGPAVVCITAPQRFGECIGSGFVIDLRRARRHQQPRGARLAEELLVTLADEHTVPAEVVGVGSRQRPGRAQDRRATGRADRGRAGRVGHACRWVSGPSPSATPLAWNGQSPRA